MFKALWNRLFRRQSNGFKPAENDELLMQSVAARLAMFGGLAQREGTVIRSIPGVTVKFLGLAGLVVPMVYADEDRAIGSIAPNGKFVYVQPRKTNG